MIRYEYRGRLMAMVVALGLGGILFGSIVVCLNIAAWTDFLSGGLDWPIGKLLFFSFSAVLPCLSLLTGCIHCTAIITQEDGMTIRTCFFLQFFVLWQDVIDLRSGTQYSLQYRRAVRKGLITIRRGLTPLHRSLPRKGSRGWQWPRGFVITSEAQGYSDLVRVIEERIGDEREQ